MTSTRNDRPRPTWWWSPLAGLVFALAALVAVPLVGLEINPDLGNTIGQVTPLTLFAGVFLAGAACTWLLLAWPRRLSAARGMATGIFVAVLSYPLVIALSEWLQRDVRNLPAPDDRLYSIFIGTTLTLATTGFATALIAAAIGAVVAVLLALPERPGPRPRRPAPTLLLGLAAIVATGLVGAYFWLAARPLDNAGIMDRAPAGRPAASHDEALAAFARVEAEEAGLGLHDLCHSTLLTHGRKVERAVIYFHGFTSCPAQADALAEQLFARGYNVYMPRMFGHGEAVPTVAMSELSAEHLVDLANLSADIARGLGDEVTVIGLSAGGTLATWSAQFRPDIDQAIAVSPFFGPYFVPAWANDAATNLTLGLPNLVFAWNPLQNLTEATALPAGMPATHSLAEIMLVGALVREAAREHGPLAPRIAMLLNDADIAVSNALTQELIADWRRHGAEVTVEKLPFSRMLPHDLINPRERGADIDLVYAALLALMDGAPGG